MIRYYFSIERGGIRAQPPPHPQINILIAQPMPTLPVPDPQPSVPTVERRQGL